MNDPRYLHTEEKQEGETFFDVMNRLIARSKAVTADMEAVLMWTKILCRVNLKYPLIIIRFSLFSRHNNVI